MSKRVPVMEIFGPTIQGEGMVIGQKTMFVRTAGCDYSCSWCDSAFTWDGTGKSEPLEAEAIVSKLDELAKDQYAHVTISGGNPALHKGIAGLVTILQKRGVKLAVETQGTIWQDWLMQIDEVTVSPKPPSSKMETDWGRLDEFMAKLVGEQASLKVVIFTDQDFQYAKAVHQRYPDFRFYLQVGNSNVSSQDNGAMLNRLLLSYEELIDKTMSDTELKNVYVLPQLHTLLWGNKRGV